MCSEALPINTSYVAKTNPGPEKSDALVNSGSKGALQATIQRKLVAKTNSHCICATHIHRSTTTTIIIIISIFILRLSKIIVPPQVRMYWGVQMTQQCAFKTALPRYSLLNWTLEVIITNYTTILCLMLPQELLSPISPPPHPPDPQQHY